MFHTKQEYEQGRTKYFEDKEKLSKLQKRMDEAKKQFAPLNKKREALTAKMDKIDDERKRKVSLYIIYIMYTKALHI